MPVTVVVSAPATAAGEVDAEADVESDVDEEELANKLQVRVVSFQGAVGGLDACALCCPWRLGALLTCWRTRMAAAAV